MFWLTGQHHEHTPLPHTISIWMEVSTYRKPVPGVQLIKWSEIVNWVIVMSERKTREVWVRLSWVELRAPTQASLGFSLLRHYWASFCLLNARNRLTDYMCIVTHVIRTQLEFKKLSDLWDSDYVITWLWVLFIGALFSAGTKVD